MNMESLSFTEFHAVLRQLRHPKLQRRNEMELCSSGLLEREPVALSFDYKTCLGRLEKVEIDQYR